MRKLLLIFLLTTGAFAQNSYFDIQSYSQFKVKSEMMSRNTASVLKAQDYSTGSDPERTPAIPAAIITQTVVGGLVGIVGGGVVGTVTVYSLALATKSNSDDWGIAMLGGMIGGYTGYVLGSAGGVYLSGKNMGMNSSLWKTMLGSVAGASLGFLIFKNNYNPVGFFVGPPLCATITFHL